MIVGVRSSVLRPRLTSAAPAAVFTIAFRVFRQALLIGAATARMPSLQVSPDKSVMLRCTSSPFTWSVFWERLRDVVLTRLADPALYDVSVRSLAAWTRMRPAAKTGRHLRTHSQASSPRSVALPQLPSSSTLSIGVDIWYAVLLEDSQSRTRDLHPIKSRPCRAYTIRSTRSRGRAVW